MLDTDVPDALDEQEEPGEDSSSCDPAIDYPGYDLSFLDTPLRPSRPATSCGDCCRQVSFSSLSVKNCRYSISGRYLVINTANASSPALTREHLIDLSNLDHYRIDEKLENMGEDIYETCGEIINQEEIIGYLTTLKTSTGPPPTIVEIEINVIDLDRQASRVHSLGEYVLGTTTPSQLRYDDGWFVWVEKRDGEPSYLGLNVMEDATGAENAVDTGDTHDISDLEMDGQRVVLRHWDHRIQIYDISGGTFTDVAGDVAFDWYRYQPGIWGDLVAWHDLREGGDLWSQGFANIYMKNIVTGEESVVCDHPAGQVAPLDIGFGLVAWPDLRNDLFSPNDPYSATNFDIFAYRIDNEEEIQVTDLPGRELCPQIFENRIYFVMEDESGILSVFEKTLLPVD
jgi:hypothetical protein